MMPEDYVVDVGIVSEEWCGPVLDCGEASGGVCLKIAGGMEPVVAAPAVGKGHCPPRVYRGEECLAYFVAEECSDKAEAGLEAAEGVAVTDEEAMSADIGSDGAIDDVDANLVAQVVKEPDVVIADEPGDAHALVSEAGEGAEEAHISSGHHGAVLIPIVEDVSYEVKLVGIIGNGVEPCHYAALVEASVFDIKCTEVYVADEVCAWHWAVGWESLCLYINYI